MAVFRKMLIRFFIAFLVCQAPAFASSLRLPGILSDHMVLQAGRETALWGKGSAGDAITIEFFDPSGASKARVGAVVGADQRWKAHLPPLPAGTAGRLSLTSGQSGGKIIEDVLVGEVWLGAGQSNMAMPVRSSSEVEDALRAADASGSQIRFFLTERKRADQPLEDLSGQWVVATSETVGPCSAVAWNFARVLHETLHVPVGLIVSAYGGTPVQAWISREALDATEASKLVWQWHRDLLDSRPQQQEIYDRKMAEWKAANPTPELQAKNARRKPKPPYSEQSPTSPTGLFNAMIAPLIPYTLQGVLWYQGENNGKDPRGYGELIQALVQSWRTAWGGEFPFYYVELANFQPAQKDPAEGGLALIREQQAEVLRVARTGCATAIDVGEARDIHPKDKATVGRRLARMALHDVYEQKLEGPSRSPRFQAVAMDGGFARLTFSDAQGLRSRHPGGIRGFAIRGTDGRWVWADAKIEGEEIVVSNPSVLQPEAVCYAWASNPRISVENSAGLPLQPFRTDQPR
jgi:sialate O-acetylesterase